MLFRRPGAGASGYRPSLQPRTVVNLAAPARQPLAHYPWLDRLLTPARPRVGDLMHLCEENYARLRRVAPDLPHWRGDYRSSGADGMDLHLEVIEQSRYTSLLRLTYFVPHGDGLPHRLPQADPDALLPGAIEEVLRSGPRTPDLGGTASTTQVGDAIARRVAQE